MAIYPKHLPGFLQVKQFKLRRLLRRGLFVFSLSLVTVLLIACQPIMPEAPAAPAATEPAEAEAPAEEAAAATVMVGTNDALGSFLVDAAGMTLYLFLNDEPGVTNCYDQCAENWPPLLVEGDPVAGEGADAALLGTTERTDGTMMVTYNGWPLYYYVQDAAPGDTVGQGRGDVWYVLDPAGEMVMAMPPAEAEAPAEEAAAATVMVGTNDALGDFLVDAAGMTLYLFLNDEPGVSNCYDQCAENWPPLLVEGDPVAGDGIDAALLGTTERTDGTMMVTYNGWPLYYYVQDAAPGDTVGHQRGDVWYVITPAGEQVP